jgi:basic membrane protein A and related proteins
MKKILSVVLSLALMGSLLVGCKGGSTTPSTAKTDSSKPKFCFVVTSQLGDKSFNDSAAAGMKMIQSQLGSETKVLEIGSDQTKWEPTLKDLSDSGEYAAIIVNGSGTSEIIQSLSAQFPKQHYVMFDSTIDKGKYPNVYAISYKQNEGSYLGGVLAALVSTSDMPYANKDKKIGFIGGSEGPIISDFLVGYIEGAQSVVPDIKVVVSYVGSWTDTAKGKEIALAQYNQGVDVIFPAAMTSGLGCIEAAVQEKKYIIGVDSDQSMLFKGTDEAKANVILTSVLKRVDLSLLRFAKMDIENKVPYGDYETLGIKEGSTDIAVNEYFKKNVPSAIQAKVDEARQSVLSGKVVVTSALGLPADKLTQILNSCKP